MSGKSHALTALRPEKTLDTYEQEAGWDPRGFERFGEEQNLFPC